jgi:RecB family exonuclease
VLRLAERDDPEDIVELDPGERGSLVHEVLERFIGEAIARPGGPPAPSSPWDADDHDRIRAIAAEAFARREAAGLTGRPLQWRRTQADVLTELGRFLEADDRHRAAGGLTPLSVEMGFGTDGAPPVHLDLPDGRPLTLRGRADRVDVGADGRLVVLDYKTGKDRYAGLADDPVQEGRTLQLGAYAEAATARHGGEVADTAYWMVSSASRFAQRGYPWSADRRARFLDVVGVIVDGIESGTFPARPGAFDAFFGTHENCRHCEFDRVCPRNRDDHADAKVDAPELSLLALLRLPSGDVVPS